MMKNSEVVLTYVKNMLMDAERIVCVVGHDIVTESGGMDIWERDEIYRIEKAYGESPEELLSAGVFYSRTEEFYAFYRNEILAHLPKPGITIEALKHLQNLGKLKAVISMNMYGLERLGGLENVIELQGSAHNAYCPICKKRYPHEFLFEAKVPLCDACKTAIRPGIRLFGERVRNDYLTMATKACSEADVILVLGMNLSGSKVQYCTGHYKGKKLILVNNKPHYTDKYADYVVEASPEKVMSSLLLE